MVGEYCWNSDITCAIMGKRFEVCSSISVLFEEAITKTKKKSYQEKLSNKLLLLFVNQNGSSINAHPHRYVDQ